MAKDFSFEDAKFLLSFKNNVQIFKLEKIWNFFVN
jgi:hypothetical protein